MLKFELLYPPHYPLKLKDFKIVFLFKIILGDGKISFQNFKISCAFYKTIQQNQHLYQQQNRSNVLLDD